jgi:hypothetical protein
MAAPATASGATTRRKRRRGREKGRRRASTTFTRPTTMSAAALRLFLASLFLLFRYNVGPSEAGGAGATRAAVLANIAEAGLAPAPADGAASPAEPMLACDDATEIRRGSTRVAAFAER